MAAATGAGLGTTGPLGVGLAFNPALADFVAAHRDTLDYLEVSPERLWHDRGPAWGHAAQRYEEIPEAVSQFQTARGDLPVVIHGVGLSIATAGPLDDAHVVQVARWRERCGALWVSEHLAYFRLGPEAGWRGIGVMLPPVYDTAALDDLIAKVRRMREMVGTEVLLENAVTYAPVADADFQEADFLNALAARAPCGLLLDLHNLYTNAVNLGEDAFATIDALDLSAVREIHIAGGEPLAGQWTDAHAGPCPPDVWRLLQYVLSQPNAVRGVTFEVDESYATRMEASALLSELNRARQIWNEATACRSRDVA